MARRVARALARRKPIRLSQRLPQTPGPEHHAARLPRCPHCISRCGPMRWLVISAIGAVSAACGPTGQAPTTPLPVTAPAIAAASSAAPADGECRTGSVALKIFGLNDFHGQLSAGRKRENRPVGSAAVLASYLRAQALGFEDRW